MFHTPPVKTDWKPETSIANSYDVSADSLSYTNSNVSNSDIGSQSETIDTDDINQLNNNSVNDNNETISNNIEKSLYISDIRDEKNDDNIGDIDNTDNIDIDNTIIIDDNVQKIDTSITLDTEINNEIRKIQGNNVDNNSIDSIKTKDKQDNSSYIESFEIATTNDLPMPLVRSYERFLKELQEPKFTRSLASFEISEIFQSFYKRFNDEVLKYIETEGKFELSNNLTDDDNIECKQYKYNLILERLLCDEFYNNIVFPNKNISIDEYESEINEKFCNKLGSLSSLHIHFKHLDIDLPEEIELNFIKKLNDIILPEFELLTAERSPTLKMKYLIKIHKKLGSIIQELTNKTTLNTDIYLPILIFTIIKLQDLREYFLIRQLNLIKRFSNEYIFCDNKFEIEKGKLLYVCANFEASISYLCSVTLDNLNLGIPSDDINLSPGYKHDRNDMLKLLTQPIKLELIDKKVQQFKNNNPLVEINKNSLGFFNYGNSNNISTNTSNSNNNNNNTTATNENSNSNNSGNTSSNSWMIDYSKFTLPTRVVHADEGLASISEAIDSSLKNIIDKVSWLSSGSNEILNEIVENETNYDNDLLKQLEENDAFQNVISNSSTEPRNSLESNEKDKIPFPIQSNENSQGKEEESNELNDKIRNRAGSTQDKIVKFTTSMGEVMKSFRSNDSNASFDNNSNNDASNLLHTPTKINRDSNNSTISNINTNNGASTSIGTGTTTVNHNNGATNIRTPINIRSRATSFISTSLFGSSNNVNNTNGLTTTPSSVGGTPGVIPEGSTITPINMSYSRNIQNSHGIFGNLRSRDNSLSNMDKESSVKDVRAAIDEIRQLKKFEKSFNDMNVSELEQMYINYQHIMSLLDSNPVNAAT